MTAHIALSLVGTGFQKFVGVLGSVYDL